MRAPLTHPSYTDIEKGCAIIGQKIIRDFILHFPYDRFDEHVSLVALSRGGLIPGVILSHYLGIALTPVCYSAKNGHGDNRNHLNNLPDLTAREGSTVIVVDDIADSGHTLREVSQHYEKKYCVETAVLYWKHGSVITPDYYWQELKQNDPWIQFSWEV